MNIMSRAEGHIESGPHEIEGNPHYWLVWLIYDTEEQRASTVSQGTLEAAGIDFSKGLETLRRIGILADVDHSSSPPNQIDPQSIRLGGPLAPTEEEVKIA